MLYLRTIDGARIIVEQKFSKALPEYNLDTMHRGGRNNIVIGGIRKLYHSPNRYHNLYHVYIAKFVFDQDDWDRWWSCNQPFWKSRLLGRREVGEFCPPFLLCRSGGAGAKHRVDMVSWGALWVHQVVHMELNRPGRKRSKQKLLHGVVVDSGSE
ncbi:hypothetical protein NPIL_248911 [Nephila pilipes]|uniref:Uncharacterized protein n=1 Tax=Nephila pilipes TaxID=299642 RepID=A0A8X6TEN5_NEPPI|nr:hypothetical protein NPIL_248911 [Nephila pilipes]